MISWQEMTDVLAKDIAAPPVICQKGLCMLSLTAYRCIDG
jgi:hypothetical protein